MFAKRFLIQYLNRFIPRFEPLYTTVSFQVTDPLNLLPGDVYRKREDHPGSAKELLLDAPTPPI